MKVIGIKFKDGGKIYYFAPKNNETYEEGMEVVVETSKSTEFAVVAFPPKDVPDAEVVQPLKPKNDFRAVERKFAVDEFHVQIVLADLFFGDLHSAGFALGVLGGHPRRDEDFGRHRAVRQGMLLRGGASRVQKSFHQNGKGAGTVAQSREDQRSLPT